jgi:hypothetical protein
LRRVIVFAVFGGAALLVACQTQPPPGPPPPIVYPVGAIKPMPQQDVEPPPPAFNDPPLVDQPLPEESWFVGTYNHVGRPRIAVFVNRGLDGSLIGESGQPVITENTVQGSTGSVNVQSSDSSGYYGYWYANHARSNEQFSSTGPAEYHESTTIYLQPGQYDDASMAALDYQEMESLLADWISSNGQVTIVSPDFIRSHMSDQDVQALQAGKASGLDALSKNTNADVLIQITAHPVRRQDQVVVLLVAEAINVRGGESLAHASVEMPTPVDRYQLNNYTRFLARKIIHGMTNTWEAAGPPSTQP